MSTPLTPIQVPDQSILDTFNRQAYLGQQFVLPINVTTIASTSETPLAYITNPAGSGKTMFIVSKKYAGNDTTFFRLYLGPTVSAPGTSTTVRNMRPACTNSSISVCYVSPTVSSNGTLLSVVIVNGGYSIDSSSMVILDPGQALLVTAQVASDGDKVPFEMVE